MCVEEPGMTKVQTRNQEYYFTKGMWSEEPGTTNVLFIIQTSNQEYKFTQGMWSEESSMTKVLCNIDTCNKEYLFTQCI